MGNKKIIFFYEALVYLKKNVLLQRRIGRVVECGGLENRCTAMYRGFESLILRKRKPAVKIAGFLFLGHSQTGLSCALKTKKPSSQDDAGFYACQGSPSGINAIHPSLVKLV